MKTLQTLQGVLGGSRAQRGTPRNERPLCGSEVKHEAFEEFQEGEE